MRPLLALLLLAACERQPCDTDDDCKGDRICDAEARLCVDPGADLAVLGPASTWHVCVAACESAKRCGSLTDAQLVTCRAECDGRRLWGTQDDAAADSRCAMAPEDRRRERACYGLECSKITSCLSTARVCPK